MATYERLTDIPTSSSSERYEGSSPLQLLYPGRPMDVSYEPDRSNIPNENPNACNFVRKVARENVEGARMVEVAARKKAGNIKVQPTPFVEPEVAFEDPELGYATAAAPSFDITPRISNSNERMVESGKNYSPDSSIIETYEHPSGGGATRSSATPFVTGMVMCVVFVLMIVFLILAMK